MTKNNTFNRVSFHIDLRIQSMSVDALKYFIIELSEFGIDTIIFEWEGTFPFENNPSISNQFAYTAEEIKEILAQCKRVGIEGIPLQQCFGHLEYILKQSKYAYLREDNDNFTDVSQVCPLKTKELELFFTDIFSEVTALHSSKYIHIGGDETRLLGHCPDCKKYVEEFGTSELFVNYIKLMCDIVAKLGKTPILWADIILKHPEALSKLPEDIIFVDWNYGWENDRFGKLDNLIKDELNYWGAPALRSHPDNFYITKWDVHFDNLKNYIPFMKEKKYQGVVMTSWSTSGAYSMGWDTNWDVISFVPIRRVYPLSGFRILLAAYQRAVISDTPIEPNLFIQEYAADRFKFNKTQAKQFAELLLKEQKEVSTHSKEAYEELKLELIKTQESASTITILKPLSNEKEYKHFILMFMIRLFYLRFKEVEYNVQNTPYDQVAQGNILKGLLNENNEIQDMFSSLQTGYLNPKEIELENKYRVERVQALYEKVVKQR